MRVFNKGQRKIEGSFEVSKDVDGKPVFASYTLEPEKQVDLPAAEAKKVVRLFAGEVLSLDPEPVEAPASESLPTRPVAKSKAALRAEADKAEAEAKLKAEAEEAQRKADEAAALAAEESGKSEGDKTAG
jgi:membrane protein involved in colicin uptake